jgi:hypothetical protein
MKIDKQSGRVPVWRNGFEARWKAAGNLAPYDSAQRQRETSYLNSAISLCHKEGGEKTTN